MACSLRLNPACPFMRHSGNNAHAAGAFGGGDGGCCATGTAVAQVRLNVLIFINYLA